MFSLKQDAITVSRLRIKGSTGDPLAARLRVENLFSAWTPNSYGLPRSAIVYIDRLHDPLPNALRLHDGSLHLPQTWEKAVEVALNQLIATAARPRDGLVRSSASAVIFADQAEWLACLASDWCEGRLATNWWWQSLLKGGDTALQIVKRQWRNSPEYVPAAMQYLSRRKNAIAFVSAFSDGEARDLLQSVTRSFALKDLSSLLDQFSPGDTPLPITQQCAPGGLPVTVKEDKSDQSPTSLYAPWHEWIAEIETRQLGPEQKLFLGVALMVLCAPAKVRTSRFAAEVQQWQHEITFQDTRGAPNVSDRPTTAYMSTAEDEPRTTPGQKSDSSVDSIFRVSSGGRQSAIGFSKTQPSIDQSHTFTDTQPESALPPALNQTEPGPDAKLQSAVIQTISAPTEIDRFEDVATGSGSFAKLETQINTNYGGLFYLINLSLYLGLYGDFTTPLARGLALNIWDFVALLGRELIGHRVQSDPVWSLLARLAARDALTQPGDDFEPDDEWRIPEEWLAPYSTEIPFLWTTAGERLRLFHPNRFVVIDVPLLPGNLSDHLGQLKREMSAYRSLEFRVSSFELREDPVLKKELETPNSKLETSSQVAVWLDRLLPYIRARLQLALGCDDSESLLRIVFEHRARVFVTAAHVDVEFSLAELPIEIRLSGLDRDPGWVPAAGRVIKFHYQ